MKLYNRRLRQRSASITTILVCLIAAKAVSANPTPDGSIVQEFVPNPTYPGADSTSIVKINFAGPSGGQLPEPQDTTYSWTVAEVAKDGGPINATGIRFSAPTSRQTRVVANFSEVGAYSIQLKCILTQPRFWPTGTAVLVSLSRELLVSKARLNTLEFMSNGPESNCVTVQKDNGGGPYDAPHYQDVKGDGATAIGERRFPVCYLRNSKMRVKATFAIDHIGDFPAGQVQVRAESLGGYFTFAATSANIGTNTIDATITCDQAFPNYIEDYGRANLVFIQWEVQIGSNGWMSAGGGSNEIYVVLSPPSAGTAYESVLDISCRSASGLTNQDDIFDAVWSSFANPSGTKGVRRKYMDGFNNIDNTWMAYWNPVNVAADNQQANLMLAAPSGAGACTAWSQLLHYEMKVQGITDRTAIYRLVPNADVTAYAGALAFLVKNWRFGDHIELGANGIKDSNVVGDDVDCAVAMPPPPPNAPASNNHPTVLAIAPGPNGSLDSSIAGDDLVGHGILTGSSRYNYVLTGPRRSGGQGDWYGQAWGDVAKQDGVAGQCNRNPPEIFANHWIVVFSRGGTVKQIYDPSYGHPGNGQGYASEADHYKASSDGILSVVNVHIGADVIPMEAACSLGNPAVAGSPEFVYSEDLDLEK